MGAYDVLLLATRSLALDEVNSVRIDDAFVVTKYFKVVCDQLDRTLLRCGDPRLPWAAEHGATPTALPVMIYHIGYNSSYKNTNDNYSRFLLIGFSEKKNISKKSNIFISK